MSINYIYNHEEVIYNGTDKNIIREKLIDGSKGLSFSIVIKKDNEYHEIYVKETNEEAFMFTEKKNKNIINEKTINYKELLKLIENNKNLNFVINYINNIKPNQSKISKTKKSDTIAKSKTPKKSYTPPKSKKTKQSGGNNIIYMKRYINNDLN